MTVFRKMRRTAAACVAGLLLTTGHATYLRGAAIQLGTPQTVTLSIVGTNDLHGGILPRGGRGGLALLAGYMKNLRAQRARDGGAVLLIDAGDMFQGTLESNLTEGASVVAAYNALGYNAAAIGNHEFDFGPVGAAATPKSPTDDPRGAIKARAAEAKFPFLAANLLDASTGRRVEWPNVQPSVLVEAAGVKVGIVGVMTKDALTTTIAANTRGLSIAPLTTAIAGQASSLRASGAAVVIVAAHAGGRCTRFDQPTDLSSCDASSEIAEVARTLPQGLVDVIVAGHVHAGMGHQVAGIAVTEAFSGGRAFGRVDLTVDRTTKHVTARRIFAPRDLCEREDAVTQSCDPSAQEDKARVRARYEGKLVAPDAAIAKVLAPVLRRVSDLKATRLGVFLETPVRRVGDVESPLGNLFTDAFRESVAKADVAINNTLGGLRADLPQGPLTYGGLYEVFPFDNLVVELNLSGSELRRMFTAQLQQSRGVVGISGISVQAQCSAGALVVTLLHASGRPIHDDERLVVVTTDFLATGGDAVFAPVIPPQGFSIPAEAPLARDVVADWLRQRGGTLREDQLVDAQHRRWVYPGPLPIDCRAR